MDEDTGEVIPIERTTPVVERGEIIDEETIQKLTDAEVKTVLLQKDESSDNEYAIIYNTLQKDPTNTEKKQFITSTSSCVTQNRLMRQPPAMSLTNSSSPRRDMTSELSAVTV